MPGFEKRICVEEPVVYSKIYQLKLKSHDIQYFLNILDFVVACGDSILSRVSSKIIHKLTACMAKSENNVANLAPVLDNTVRKDFLADASLSDDMAS